MLAPHRPVLHRRSRMQRGALGRRAAGSGRFLPAMPRGEAEEVWRCARRDPVFYFRTLLRAEPWEKQQQILRALAQHRRVAVRSCHASGKSWLAAGAARWFIDCFGGPDETCIVVTTAPTFRQVEKVLWAEIKAHTARAAVAGIRLPGRVMKTEIKIAPKHFGFGVATDDPDRLQGLHATNILIIVDEASGIEPEMWEAIEALLSGGNAYLLMIGNPTDPTTYFAREFISLPPAQKFAISAFDTPNLQPGAVQVPGLVTREWVEDKRKRWGEHSPMYQSRVLGQFPASAADTLIPLGWIERAHRLWERLHEQDEALRAEGKPVPAYDPALGCDIARYGDDDTVFAVRRGPRVKIVFEANGLDTMDTAGRIMALAKELGCVPKVDELGMGVGVVDRIREEKMRVHAMNVAETAIDQEHFTNLRAEWFWTLRGAFEAGLIALDPEDTDTAHELSSIKYKYSAGKIQIELKDDTKKRLGRSPDRADAVMLAWVEPFNLGVRAPVVGAVAIGAPASVPPAIY